MAHCCIFELSREHIPEDERLTADTFAEDTNFVGRVADYVTDTDDGERDFNLDWLNDTVNPDVFEFTQGQNGDRKIRLLPGGKEAFFGERLEKLKETVEAMEMADFTDRWKILDLTDLITEKFTFYFTLDGTYYTIEEFLRATSEGDEFHVGGVLDYHY